MSLRIGDFFTASDGSNYEVTQRIDSGGFGETFFVTEKGSGSQFVAKSPTQIEEVRMKSLELEYGVLNDLESKGVDGVMRAINLVYFDGPNGRFPILVLEEARGVTLQDVCMTSGMGYDDVSDVLSKISKSMAQVHDAGYMHLDIAPDNIFVEDPGGANEITIIDFGIAARKSDTSTFAVDQHGMSKAFFGAPEQRDSPPQASQRSDVFALGAVGFCLILGYEKTILDIYRNKKPDPPYDLSYYVPVGTIPPDHAHLQDVVRKATWPTKDGRFCTIEEMGDAIAGKEPDTNFPRIVIDNKVYPLKGDGPWMMGREEIFGESPDIVVKDKAVSMKFISRKHANIERRSDGILVLHHTGLNDTRVKIGRGSKVRWNKVGPAGYPLGARFQEICFGFAEHPPEGAFDEGGNPLMPGPYKTLEFQPPGDPSGTQAITA